MILALIIGNCLAALLVGANSFLGAYYHVGYPVSNRAVWGMYGSAFPVYNRILLSTGKGFYFTAISR